MNKKFRMTDKRRYFLKDMYTQTLRDVKHIPYWTDNSVVEDFENAGYISGHRLTASGLALAKQTFPTLAEDMAEQAKRRKEADQQAAEEKAMAAAKHLMDLPGVAGVTWSHRLGYVVDIGVFEVYRRDGQYVARIFSTNHNFNMETHLQECATVQQVIEFLNNLIALPDHTPVTKTTIAWLATAQANAAAEAAEAAWNNVKDAEVAE